MNCKNCGFRHDGDDSFCRKCGAPIEAPVINPIINVVRVPVTTVEKQTKKSGATEIIKTFLQVVFAFLATISSFVLLMTLFFDRSILPIILFLMFLPNAIVLLMLFRKTVPSLQRSKKRYYIIAVILFIIIGFILLPDSSQVPLNNETPVDTQTTSSYSMQSTQSEQATTETLTANQEMDLNLRLACEEIGIVFSEISNVKQKDDWVGGPRYVFNYRNTTFILYYNYDYSVESINLGFTKIYDKGYEPRDVNDFLLDSDMILPLQTYAIECVKPYLNNPDKADFSMFDWGFSRYAEKYMVSGIVTDKDTQGQSVEIPFYLEVEASGESFEPLYLEMNGSVIFVSETVVEIPEPSPLPTETQPTVADKGDTITLVYGELGEYGKTVTIDGKDYIWFAVPSGKYLVKSKVPSCTIFVNKDEIKKNAEGYGETQIVIMLPITADDEPKEIYVGEDEHIFITISATVEITPVK